MSKRELKKYLEQLPQEHLQAQIMELYQKFPSVKTYYDFVFKPNEDKLLDEAKAKIRNEYFPLKRRKPKARRSVAQKFIKHYMTLGMESHLLTDLMLFNLETMLEFSKLKPQTSEAFYKSALNSFELLISFVIENGLVRIYRDRVEVLIVKIHDQEWPNLFAFEMLLEQF